jgi:hypothetical protein
MPLGCTGGRSAWGTAGWVWRPITSGVAGPAGSLDEDVEGCQVLGIVARLDAASHQRGVDRVPVAGEADRRGARHRP